MFWVSKQKIESSDLHASGKARYRSLSRRCCPTSNQDTSPACARAQRWTSWVAFYCFQERQCNYSTLLDRSMPKRERQRIQRSGRIRGAESERWASKEPEALAKGNLHLEDENAWVPSF